MLLCFSVLDSIAKIPSGFFNGNLLWTGSYDECVNETAVIYLGQNGTNATYPFKGKYCRVGIPLAPPQSIAVDIQVSRRLCKWKGHVPYFFGHKTEFFPSKTIPKI